MKCFVMLACSLSFAIICILFRNWQTAAVAIHDMKNGDPIHVDVGHGSSHGGTVAICVTGQLARLELLSKIRNIVLPYLEDGHKVRMYVYLDSETADVGQTMWNFNYSNTPHIKDDKSKLESFILSAMTQAAERRHLKPDQMREMLGNFFVLIRLEPIPRVVFQVVDQQVLVDHKKVNISKYGKIAGHEHLMVLRQNSSLRFQMNLRMMAGIRECAKWVMADELENDFFFDLIVR